MLAEHRDTLYFRYSVSGLGTEIQTGMAEDLHILFVLPISWQQVSSSNHCTISSTSPPMPFFRAYHFTFPVYGLAQKAV